MQNKHTGSFASKVTDDSSVKISPEDFNPDNAFEIYYDFEKGSTCYVAKNSFGIKIFQYSSTKTALRALPVKLFHCLTTISNAFSGFKIKRGSREAGRSEATSFLALGSNIGNRIENIENALLKLSKRGIQILTVSSLYETEPVGYRDQEWFINQVVHIKHTLNPFELLVITQGIESELGRQRKIKWHPRTIDIDIIIYDDLIISTPTLIIPHPELHKRNFVLIPLAEIAPCLLHPVLNKKIKDLVIDTWDKDLVKKI